jgi:hypothetical protein
VVTTKRHPSGSTTEELAAVRTNLSKRNAPDQIVEAQSIETQPIQRLRSPRQESRDRMSLGVVVLGVILTAISAFSFLFRPWGTILEHVQERPPLNYIALGWIAVAIIAVVLVYRVVIKAMEGSATWK